MADDRCPDMSKIDALKATQKGQYRYGADANWGVLEGGTYLRNLPIRLNIPCAVAMQPYVKLFEHCCTAHGRD